MADFRKRRELKEGFCAAIEMVEDSRSNNHRSKPSASEQAPVDDEIEELRSLLFQEERNQLDRISRRLDDPHTRAVEVGRVLGEAIDHGKRHDGHLAEVLQPDVDQEIRKSVRRDPDVFADAIFPALGPAIRKSIADSLRRLVQVFHQTLEHSLSPRSLRWRLEAFRSGRSFAEVVLIHILPYRVEQMFLIHRESGLLLRHEYADTVSVRDSDLVSGMLTAIRDFATDSFELDDGASLDALRVGELTVWVESGPAAILAAVIRGAPPQELRVRLQATLEDIHREFGEQLSSFDGRADALQTVGPALQEYMLESTPEPVPEARQGRVGKVAAAICALLLVVGLAFWTYRSWDESRTWAKYIRDLEEAPGLVVVDHGRDSDGYFVRGLRDALAVDPDKIVNGGMLARSEWRPYYSVEPEIVVERAVQLLEPPPTVTLDVDGETLKISGRARSTFIESARRLAPTIPGIARVADSELAVVDQEARILDAANGKLRPPETVAMSLDGGILRLRGKAPERWIESAATLARTVDGVDDVDLSELQIDGLSARLLAQAITLLKPPESVELSLTGGRLSASGSCRQEWLEAARALVRVLPDVSDFDTARLRVADIDQVLLGRAELLLLPPETVRLSVEERVLRMTGEASHDWASRAKRFAGRIPELLRVDASRLIDVDVRYLIAAKDRIESVRFSFARNASDPSGTAAQSLAEVAVRIDEVRSYARRVGDGVVVEVVAYTNDTGDDDYNRRLALARAERIVDLLVEQGVPRELLSARGHGAASSKGVRKTRRDRRAELRVILTSKTP